jgi:hypothetical protein
MNAPEPWPEVHWDEWQSATTQFLAADPWDLYALCEVAQETLGISYDEMPERGWRRLTGIITGCGYRKREACGNGHE